MPESRETLTTFSIQSSLAIPTTYYLPSTYRASVLCSSLIVSSSHLQSPTVLHSLVTGSHPESIPQNISLAFLYFEPIWNFLIHDLTLNFLTSPIRLPSIPIHFILGAVESCPFGYCFSSFHPRNQPFRLVPIVYLASIRTSSTPHRRRPPRPPHLASSKSHRACRLHLLLIHQHLLRPHTGFLSTLEASPLFSYIYTILALYLSPCWKLPRLFTSYTLRNIFIPLLLNTRHPTLYQKILGSTTYPPFPATPQIQPPAETPPTPL